MYTCHINKDAYLSPTLVSLLNDLVWLVTWAQDDPINLLGKAIANECLISVRLNERPLAYRSQNEHEIVVHRQGSRQVLLTITKVTQEPAPALLIVDSMNDAEDLTEMSTVFPDTEEGMKAALAYVKELRESEDSSATIATIYRLLYNGEKHTYLPEGDHVQQIQF